MKIALISCTSRKKEYSCKAAEMYSPSPRFSLAYKYAKQVSDKVYILSAKYGLLSEDEVIETYNETLIHKSIQDRRIWSNLVIQSLEERHSLESDEFIILAGRTYNEYLLPSFKHYQLPLEGLSMGRWIPKLKQLNELGMNIETEQSKSLLIHKWLTSLSRYSWKNINSIPFENGVYIMFESGEKFCGMDRIVRIGTHRAEGRLKERLRDHFLKENKDGSILRKNIGLSLLRKTGHSFEDIWALDWSKSTVKNQFVDEKYSQAKKEIEGLVSSYLRENIWFTCIRVDGEKERLKIEETLIASLNGTEDFRSSANWLGRYSPKSEISSSGLWNTQGLNGNGFRQHEIEALKAFVLQGTSISNIHDYAENRHKEKVYKKLIAERVISQVERVSISDIKVTIRSIIEKSRRDGLQYVDVVSGEVHRQMNLSNKMPSVCSAMYQLMDKKDTVLCTTPSGKSSTIKIRYFL